ncbi:copia protein [Tanacetum coccineum]
MHNKFMAVVQKIVHDAWNLEDSLSGVRETWSAIERLNQGDSLNVQVVKTNLFWDLGSLLLEMENPWNLMSHGFYKLMNELTKEQLASFTNASECSFLQQLSTRRVEVVTVQAEQEIDTSHIYQVAPKPQDRMNIHNAIFLKISGLPDTKAKENRQNPVTPQLIRLLRKTVIRTSSEGQFGNQRDELNNDSGGARETVGSPVVQQNGIQCFNCKGFGHYARECKKPKRVKDYAYHKEKMMWQNSLKRCFHFKSEQADWLEDTDEEIDEQELEAHYSYMAKIQEVSPEETSSTSQPLEQIPYDTSDPANRFCPNGEETVTLEKESRSKFKECECLAQKLHEKQTESVNKEVFIKSILKSFANGTDKLRKRTKNKCQIDKTDSEWKDCERQSQIEAERSSSQKGQQKKSLVKDKVKPKSTRGQKSKKYKV